MVKELRLALRPFLISFFAHPTSTTAAIVVIRRCFISLQLSILHPSCRHVCVGGRRFRFAFVVELEVAEKTLVELDFCFNAHRTVQNISAIRLGLQLRISVPFCPCHCCNRDTIGHARPQTGNCHLQKSHPNRHDCHRAHCRKQIKSCRYFADCP